ncbi:hypothetical protein AMJ52_02575 [candidate division TA06 bacterium DG_78]|uniref:Insertion element IS150 protein InsJ-like helix-turn-helix domain-containing protein n=1 Tax=candidate division TA06 bacterium DG_78 TaxID=1703772 RepID=A0A0S7YID3_UNCT6|nr:MAG: hypothetical protein AMJ52_02575 [candidate division TA06 bacterium DG_78]
MNNINTQRRLEFVEYYLNSENSLRKTAEKFRVSYRAVFKWVKLYKKHGKNGLLSTYKKPWNRIQNEIEEKVALLKEHDPALTIRKARYILGKEGIKISNKGIMGIWKRYRYAITRLALSAEESVLPVNVVSQPSYAVQGDTTFFSGSVSLKEKGHPWEHI